MLIKLISGSLFWVNVIYITVIVLLILSHYDLSRSLEHMKNAFEVESVQINELKRVTLKRQSIRTRDFIRHECNEIRRIGGLKMYQESAPNPMYRIDGAWYKFIYF